MKGVVSGQWTQVDLVSVQCQMEYNEAASDNIDIFDIYQLITALLGLVLCCNNYLRPRKGC